MGKSPLPLQEKCIFSLENSLFWETVEFLSFRETFTYSDVLHTDLQEY